MWADGPRIVNFVNFVRQNDFRTKNSERLLYDATRREARLLRRHGMPATFLLQYDALVDTRYQKLFKQGDGRGFELGCWMEITEPQVRDAGMEWRGRHPWDPQANVAFLTGYTQEERARLIDAYMDKFREVFGRLPESVGSWYIDAWSLEYMAGKYHIVASCNCKDQVGTDGYTLWGGYWNQAYYPSRVNGYMPAQTREGQIGVPVFRMLGSDPIYQYDDRLRDGRQKVVSLEPVYGNAGADKSWVECFFDAIVRQPCLAFNYAQAGQENSFTWAELGKGLTMQVAYIDSLRQSGLVKVMTLADAGRWFSSQYPLTPPTAVVAERDSRGEGNSALWYDSRFYRASVTFDRAGNFRLRDLHMFDERVASRYYREPGQSSRFEFYALPVVDGLLWSRGDTIAGVSLVRVNSAGMASPVRVVSHRVTEKDTRTLSLTMTDDDGHTFRLDMGERGMTLTGPREDYWALQLTTAPVSLPFTQLTDKRLAGRFEGCPYVVEARRGHLVVPPPSSGSSLRLCPEQGRMELLLDNSAAN